MLRGHSLTVHGVTGLEFTARGDGYLTLTATDLEGGRTDVHLFLEVGPGVCRIPVENVAESIEAGEYRHAIRIAAPSSWNPDDGFYRDGEGDDDDDDA